MKTRILTAIVIIDTLLSYTTNVLLACPIPTADLSATVSPYNVFVGGQVNLDGHLSSPAAAITQYKWDFHYDGTFHLERTTSTATTCYSYPQSGTYTVALKVVNSSNVESLITLVSQCEVVVTNEIHNPTKNMWYSTIQDAINNANDSAVIEIGLGTYNENINFSSITGQNVTIRSTDPCNWDVVSRTIINASNHNIETVTFQGHSDVVLAGFKITGGLRGIKCDGASPTIQNCIITGNGQISGSGGGIYNCNSATPLITNCFIVDNAANNGAGLYNDSSSPAIRNCVISRNAAVQNGGGLYNNNSAPALWNCTIVNNTAGSGGGMYSTGSGTGQMWSINCIFWYNSASNQVNEICNSSSASPVFFEYCNCNISGSGGSLNWGSKNKFGSDYGGNIDSPPFFKPIQCVEDGLVGYWKFDETSGVVANDSAGANNGTIYGATWTTGKIDGALSFNGASDYVDCGSGPSNYDNITVSVWMKTSTAGVLVSNRYNSYSYGTWYTLTSTDIAIGDNSQGGFRQLTFNTPTLDGVWHHIVYTKDGINHAIYVDGSLDQSFTSNADINCNAPTFIGKRWTKSSSIGWFNGIIDEVRIYNRALSASEVSELHQYSNMVEQHKYRLNHNSPCRNAGSTVEIPAYGVGKTDIDNEIRVREGQIDIGADEYVVTEFPYSCSFETYQGFQNLNGYINGAGNWIGNAQIRSTNGGSGSVSQPYQYVDITPNSTLYREFVSKETDNNSYVRVSCIPSPGSYVNIRQDDVNIASVWFGAGADDTIYVLSNGSYVNSNIAYQAVANQCRAFLGNPSLSGFSYENTWVELEFVFDWQHGHYDVHWQHCNNPGGSFIKTGAVISGQYSTFSEIRFQTGISTTSHFELNRVSISDKASSGGTFGLNEDIWITSPEGSWESPLQGGYDIKGSLWYDKLGRYEIKICPTDQIPDEIITKDNHSSDNWLLVQEGNNVVANDILGYLSTAKFFNGDYYIRIFLYDDLNRLKNPLVVTGDPNAWKIGCVTKNVYYNGQNHETVAEYPIVGRLKGGQSYHFEEKPDVSINWPGSFPFEFKRIYDSRMRKQLYPLFFGWTHNNNIHVMESTTSDFETDTQGIPIADAHGLGIGRLYLMLPVGSRAFDGHVDENDTTRNTVIYLPLDNEPDYIKRTSVVRSSGQQFDVNYTYYRPDGIKYTFEKTNNALSYQPQANEGAVDWMTYIGIDRQEDRFGNALVYTWDTQELFLIKIESKVNGALTGVKIILGIGPLNGWSEGPDLYNSISVQYGTTSTVNYYNYDVTFTAFASDCYSIDDLGYGCNDDRCVDCDWGAIYSASNPDNEPKKYYQKYYGDAGFILDRAPEFLGLPNNLGDTSYVALYFGSDGSLLEKWIYICMEQTPIEECFRERYSDDYDEQGNLISTAEFFGPYSSRNRYKICKTVSDPTGAVLSQKYLVYPFTGTDAYVKAGDGAVRDVNYLYEDTRFPLKPTTMFEYFDDDGDTIYDKPARMTKITYDDRGNMVQNRVYANTDDFVLTEYDYHPKYNFPTRVTTWQDYCTETGGQILRPADSRKVEQRSIYGNADGTMDVNGAYLVQQKTLLDAPTDNWAVTKCTYYATGQPKTIESPRTPGIGSYYHCDDTSGLVTKIWEGVNITGGEPTTTAPQKRYCYDSNGRVMLEGDNLGQVKLYAYDKTSLVTSIKTFEDSTVMSPQNNFVADSYSGRTDFVKLRVLEDYDRHNNPVREMLDTGGWLYHHNWHNGKYVTCSNLDPSITGYAVLKQMIYPYPYPNGQIQWIGVFDDEGWNSYNGPIDKRYLFDPMDRLSCIYTKDGAMHGDAENQPQFYKIEDYNYYGSGKLKNEKVYNRVETGVILDTLEKNVNYFYDGLDRLIKKVEDPRDNPALGLNITVQYGYDAAGNNTYTVDPKGNIIFTDYDQANRKVCEYFAVPVVYYTGTTNVDVASSSAYIKQKTKVEYFADNKVQSVIHYDWDGNTVLSKTEFTYDDRNRIASVSEDILPGQDPAVTRYEYKDAGQEFTDASGDKYHIKITDAEFKVTLIALDIDGKTKRTLYPSGHYENTEDLLGGYQLRNGTSDNWNVSINKVQKTTGQIGGSSQTVVAKRGLWGEITEIDYPDNGHLDFNYYMVAFENLRKPWKSRDFRTAVDKPAPINNTLEYKYEYDYRTDNLKRYIVSENDVVDYIIDYNSLVAYPGQTKDIQVTRFTQSNPYPYGELIYDVTYNYDMAGRLIDVNEPFLSPTDRIASFGYDKNGNRSQLKYYLDGTIGGDAVSVDYTYNLDNMLTGFTTSNGPVFTLGNVSVDGLGRLTYASEAITTQIYHTYTYTYDMRSQLTYAKMTNNVPPPVWISDSYTYYMAGNVQLHTSCYYPAQPMQEPYSFNGDLMTQAGFSGPVGWNDNGDMSSNYAGQFTYNWDNKLRHADTSQKTIDIKYDPMGNRVWKQSTVSEQTTTRKYIVDISSGLPTILLEIDPTDSSLKKTYIWANGEILAQHDGSCTADRYFYLNDRLGSVRELIGTDGLVKNHYTYGPFGKMRDPECTETVENTFKFTGQFFDSEIGQYYMRARQYDPQLMRFTGRDSIKGNYKEPMTLHRYLYCRNEPINHIDPSGNEDLGEQLVTNAIMGTLMGVMSSIPKASASGNWQDLVVGGAGGMASGLITPWFSGFGLFGKCIGSMMASGAGTTVQEGLNRAWLGKKSEQFMTELGTSVALGGLFEGLGGLSAEGMSYRDALRKGLSGDSINSYMQSTVDLYSTAFSVEAQMISDIIWQGWAYGNK